MALNRWLLIAGLGLLYAVGSVAFVFGALAFKASSEFEPLEYQSPQRVLNPIIRPGEKLIVEAYKCNTADHPISVSVLDGSPIIRNLDTQALTPRGGPSLAAAVRAPGCPLLHFENSLPSLAPGRYRMEGVEFASEGTNTQREAWFTETFCVTDAEGEGC